MADLTSTDLLDPAPPIPGPTERAAVAARAGQLVRRRRSLQGAGALAVVAVIALSVGMLTSGGSGSSPGTQRVQAAGSAAPVAETPAPVSTTTPAVAAVPAPQPDPATTTVPAPIAIDPPLADSAPPAPTTVTVSGHASNLPAGVTLTVSLNGPGGTFSAVADGSGSFSIGNVPTGTYTGTWEWVSADGTATGAGRIPGIDLTADQDVSFSVT